MCLLIYTSVNAHTLTSQRNNNCPKEVIFSRGSFHFKKEKEKTVTALQRHDCGKKEAVLVGRKCNK